MAEARTTGLLLLSAALVSCAVVTTSRAEVGDASCDVVLDYVATSPASAAQFTAFLEGYLASEKTPSTRAGDDREIAALMARVVDYCKRRPDANFVSAVAAVAKK